ncbi:MAG: TPM domain-containing protein, partial [Pyrinomonadaceae bacterium]
MLDRCTTAFVMLAALNRNRRTRGLLVFVAVAFALLTLFATAYGQETASPIPRPEPFTFVNDYAGVMDQSSKTTLEAILTNLATQQKIEMAVVTVRTTGDQEIFDYSLAIGRGWKIGPKDSDQAGLLLVVAIDDRKYFTQVSKDLEDELPDGLAGSLQRQYL